MVTMYRVYVQSGDVPKGMAKSSRNQRTHQLEYIERWNQPGVLWQQRGAGLADLPLSLKTCRRKTPPDIWEVYKECPNGAEYL